MADDREVLREVWQGRIPTAFTLSDDDVDPMSRPEPYFLMLPRQSYVAVVIDKIRKHFSKYLHRDKQDVDSEAEMWFDYEGSPIKWHLPAGVLYDQIAVQNPDLFPPWNLTVHFGGFPDEEILRCNSREVIESHFMSCVKEADQIKHGGRIISAMQKKDHNQLWQGLYNDKFDQFWAVNRKLMAPGWSADDKSFKYIPFRLYEGENPLMQKLVKPVKSSGEGDDSSSSETESQVGKRLSTLRDFFEEILPDKNCDELKIITQGISPDLSTPLQWMSEHLSYPDNFLHICVK